MPYLQIALISLASILVVALSVYVVNYVFIRRVRLKAEAEKLMAESEKIRVEIKRIQEDLLRVRDEASNKIEKIIGEKEQRFINLPSIAFHYADKEWIKASYDDKFKEPTIASLVSEITGETGGEVKGSLPQIIESRIGSKDISKWISNIKLPETSLNSMFIRYQRETILSKQVTLGLEEVDIELSEINAFDDTINTLTKRFDLLLDEKLLEEQRIKLKVKAAERTLSKLEQITGAVLIEGRFKIDVVDEYYKCTYQHPVNDYLPKGLGIVSISVSFPKALVEARFSGNYAQSIGRLIPLKIYGTVWEPVDRKSGSFDLKVNAIAIYS